MSVFVVMRHVEYECGDALGAAASLERAQELASAAARVVADVDEGAQLAWKKTRDDAWACDLGIVAYEIREFEVT